MPAHSFRMHSTTQAYNQAIQSFLTPDINKCYEQRATTSTTMQLSDMTKSMIGLRSLSFKSAKEYILCIPSLYYTLLVMLSWVKEQMWMEKKSYKISSIIRHFNEHYISQLSMLIVLSICFSVKVFALAQRYTICFLHINKTEKFFSPTLP